jgi:hypothetical protein
MSKRSPSARCDRRCRRKPAVSAGCSCQASSGGRLPRRQRPSNRPCLCRRRRRLPFPRRPATAHLRRATSPRGCCRRWSQHPRRRSVCGGSRVMSGGALRRSSPLSAIRARWLRAPEDVPLGAWRAPAGASEDVAVARLRLGVLRQSHPRMWPSATFQQPLLVPSSSPSAASSATRHGPSPPCDAPTLLLLSSAMATSSACGVTGCR